MFFALLLCLTTLSALARSRHFANSRIICNFHRGVLPSSRAQSKLCMARNEVLGQAGPAGDDKKKVSDQVNPSHVRQ